MLASSRCKAFFFQWSWPIAIVNSTTHFRSWIFSRSLCRVCPLLLCSDSPRVALFQIFGASVVGHVRVHARLCHGSASSGLSHCRSVGVTRFNCHRRVPRQLRGIRRCFIRECSRAGTAAFEYERRPDARYCATRTSTANQLSTRIAASLIHGMGRPARRTSLQPATAPPRRERKEERLGELLPTCYGQGQGGVAHTRVSTQRYRALTPEELAKYTELGLHGLRAWRFGATQSFAKTPAVVAREQCVCGATLRSHTTDVQELPVSGAHRDLDVEIRESESDDCTRVQAHE